MNKKPLVFRTCILSRKTLLKSEMFRLVKQNGKIYFDFNQNMFGRGYYISKDKELIKKSKDKHSLSKILRLDVPEELYNELLTKI